MATIKNIISGSMGNKEILLGITTTARSDWHAKIQELSDLDIQKAALFPTMLEFEERKELYGLLKKSSINELPHVHLRHDMEEWELELFVNEYKTRVFNIHPWHGGQKRELKNHFLKYKHMIYIENLTLSVPVKEELDMFSGFCLDFSHWESGILTENPVYENFEALIDEYKVGCAHLSVINAEPHPNPDRDCPGRMDYDSHWTENVEEFDYLKKYKNNFPDILSIELENPIKEQLKAKEYLEKIING
ncbi:MAG: hypothetical protein WC238_02545 [Parcubacteria group bacterium]